MTIITTTKTMRPRDPDDHYPTPLALCIAALSLIQHSPEMYILDPGAGTGVFGQAARELFPDAVIAGTDFRPLSRPSAYDYWQSGGYNFLHSNDRGVFDLVIGNPPYKLAESFVRKGLQCLKDGGSMIYLLRLAFLEGQARQRGLWRDMPPRAVAVCGKRPSFTGDRKTDATAYAVFIWQKQTPPNARHSFPLLTWLDWDYEDGAKPSRNKGATA